MEESNKNFLSGFHYGHLIVIIVLLQLIIATGSSDSSPSCGKCRCYWNSGKTTADCNNTALKRIPTDLNSDIQILDLSYNSIPEIRHEEFYDAKLENLHKIFMRNCTLIEINRDAFKELAVLFELDLSSNLLTTLHPGIFSGLVKLRILLINNNQIEYIKAHLFENLKHLQRIEFKHNRIREIELNSFINLPHLMMIYLDSNQLTYLSQEHFLDMPKLRDLSLTQNPWNCTCELRKFRDFTFNQRLYTPPTDCQNPQHLRGKLWSDIQAEDFACQPKITQPRLGTKIDVTSENVTLTCRILASPKPNIFWMFNKRPININDHRYQIRYSNETNKNISNNIDVFVCELTIFQLRTIDKGLYSCLAENRGGKAEASIQLNFDYSTNGSSVDSSSYLLLIICIIIFILLTILIVAVIVLCWCCRRINKYSKETTGSENGLVTSKMDKTQNGSMLEGSVIMEMQKSLLTEVNPVEKPPRRTEPVGSDEINDIKKTLLDETPFGSHDEETNSIALSDTTPRSRQTFVDDGCGTNLPPDLLAFPARVAQSPSLQSSMSNLPDNRLYAKSPLASPVYQHVTSPSSGIYGTTSTGFRTLQHPKNRTLATNNNRSSPFMPAPIIYPPVVMKQGYMTIPRKPRVPSWTPSNSTLLSEFQPSITSNGSISTDTVEPVYDNLGLRTTAGGNSLLNINKAVNSPNVKNIMKDRPLPPTPNTISSINSTKIYEPIRELKTITMNKNTEPIYGIAKTNHNLSILSNNTNNGSIDKILKVPPRPPPKPKKKISVISNGQGSTSQLFEDEGEDGTEV